MLIIKSKKYQKDDFSIIETSFDFSIPIKLDP